MSTNGLPADYSSWEMFWKSQVAQLTQQLAAENLRADTLATYLGEHAYVINCGSCIMLLERTPEDWAALALGGKEQK